MGTGVNTKKYLNTTDVVGTGNVIKASLLDFSGTGADGALTISSGTTTLDLGGLTHFTKNYSSISITGTGKLAFTNKHASGTIVILKSQGDVIITSTGSPTIDLSGLGANGGAAAAAGTDGIGNFRNTNKGNGGTAGAAVTFYGELNYRVSVIKDIAVGAGGSGGGNGGGATQGLGGNGGAGGGALLIQCGGAYNFSASSSISVAGLVGTAGTNATGSFSCGGGGGAGGAGGFVYVIYNSLTANAGTYTITGGNGAAAGSPVSGWSGSPRASSGTGGGGGGHSYAGGAGGAAGIAYNNGGNGNAGSGTGGGTGGAGTVAADNGGSGGGAGGAAGLVLVLSK